MGWRQCGKAGSTPGFSSVVEAADAMTPQRMVASRACRAAGWVVPAYCLSVAHRPPPGALAGRLAGFRYRWPGTARRVGPKQGSGEEGGVRRS